jgi:hypothetical protein
MTAVPALPTTGDALQATLGQYHRHLHVVDEVPILAMLGAYAANRLPGDPVWLLEVTGSSRGKTERMVPLAARPDVIMVSTIASEGALLSGTPKKETASSASGGLLRQVDRLGGRAVLVVKDFTSIVSAIDRDDRARVLPALREVYDGRWDRNVGTDGGRTLSWEGKVGLIAACTTAWDSAHSVIAAMGDRFLVVRPRAEAERAAEADRAASNASHQEQMRDELRGAVEALMAATEGLPTPDSMPAGEGALLTRIATFVTHARTPVERARDHEIELVHALEGPARFRQQLEQLWRGLMVIGCIPGEAWGVVTRIAVDSLPIKRHAALVGLAGAPADGLTVEQVVARAGWGEPATKTMRRTVEDLECLHLVDRVGPHSGRRPATFRLTSEAETAWDLCQTIPGCECIPEDRPKTYTPHCGPTTGIAR